jgi:nucleoside-diphosphate-sugar epimerase
MTVLVTGATGLIGSNVCKLLLDQGETVRALVRDPAAAQELADMGAELVVGDIKSEADVRRAAHGASAIVNSAALLGGSAQDLDEQIAANHMGSVFCYDAARDAGVRVVELTTTTFLRHDTPLTEHPSVLDENEAGDDPYTVTKGRAYRDGLQRAQRGENILFVVPGGTFGPAPLVKRALGSTSFNRLVRAALRGRVEDYVSTPVPWVRAEDVARCTLLALTKGEPGLSYLAFGAEPAQSTATFLNLACETAGLDHRVRDVTVDPDDPDDIARYGETVVRLAHKHWPDPWFDNTLTRTTLGYSPISLRDACAETVEWLRANGEIE